MSNIIVHTRAGDTFTLPAKFGHSIMEIIRDSDLDELEAMCGGCCSCATCHIQVNSAFLTKLPKMNSEESDLLDSSAHRCSSSRLSCQILYDDSLNGLEVVIAPDE